MSVFTAGQRLRGESFRLDPRPFIERLLDDEGLTAGLTDTEARLLIGRLVDRLERLLADTEDAQAATAIARSIQERGRKIARLIVALCYEPDVHQAKQLWSELAPDAPQDPMDSADAAEIVRRLTETEEK